MSNLAKNQGFSSARPMADYVGKFLDPILERRSGINLDLLNIWDELAGADYRACSRPHKLIWPRVQRDESGEPIDFEPATLVVACVPGYGLFLQHDSVGLLSRVNSYFGYTAVGRIKIIDDTTDERPITNVSDDSLPSRTLDESSERRLMDILSCLEDGTDKKSLELLGRDVFMNNSNDTSKE